MAMNKRQSAYNNRPTISKFLMANGELQMKVLVEGGMQWAISDSKRQLTNNNRTTISKPSPRLGRLMANT